MNIKILKTALYTLKLLFSGKTMCENGFAGNSPRMIHRAQFTAQIRRSTIHRVLFTTKQIKNQLDELLILLD
jgi:hypothetical protein